MSPYTKDTHDRPEPEAARPPADEGAGPSKLVLFGLLLGLVLGLLDGTIVGTALPTIVGDLGGLDHLSWVVTSYLLTASLSTPIWGKLGDLYGRKGSYVWSVTVFLMRLRTLRTRPGHGPAHRLPRTPGARRGRPHGRRDLHHRCHAAALPGRPLPGDDRGHDACRPGRRPAARRLPDRPAELALGLLRQHPDRRARPPHHRAAPAPAHRAGQGADRLRGQPACSAPRSWPSPWWAAGAARGTPGRRRRSSASE